jgi:hypothetical protein
VQVDEGRAKRGDGPTKFGLVSSTETCARASECILAMELEAGPGEQLQVGYLRSYENMGRAVVSIDGAAGGTRVDLDGWWAERSSQYNSVLLPMAAGAHTLRVERLDEPDDAAGRGLNKFKILDIAVY